MRRHLLPVMALVGLVLAAPSGAAVAAETGAHGHAGIAAAAPIRVIQHNTDHVPAAWDFALEHVRATDPELVMLQEVCRPWFDKLQAAEPQWTMAFHPRKRHFGNSKNPGCHGDFIGEAVIYTGAPGRPTLTPDYPNNNADGAEKFGMACVEIQHGGVPTLGCSTHLSAYPTSGGSGTQPERGPQVQSIMDETAPYRAAGWAVVLGGDFNMTSKDDNPKQTPHMNLLMGPQVGGSGAFYDASQHLCGCRLTKPTTDKGNRIDYIFAADTRLPWASRTTMTYADSPAGHHLLEAVLWMRQQPQDLQPALARLDAMLTSYNLDGTVSATTTANLRDRLDLAQRHASEGSETRTISRLEQFIARADNQVKGDDADTAAGATLIAAAQALIVQLHAMDEPAA